MGEELAGIGSRRGRGPRSADVDAGVVVGAADAGDALHLGELSCGSVELVGPGAVADLPGPEQLREPAPVARLERRGDGVEGVSERACDLVGAQVLGAFLDAPRVAL